MNKKEKVNTTFKEVNIALGHRLRELRMKNNYTQKQIGEALGVTCWQVQSYENGKNSLPTGRLYILCKLYKMHPGDVFGPDFMWRVKDEQK